MKLIKTITLSVAMIAFTFLANAQIQPVEAPMFGNVRVQNPALTHQFGVISGKVQTYTFKIKNETDMDMQIVDISIPAQVGVTLHNSEIKPKSEGELTVRIDPTIMRAGGFLTKIIVTTKQSKQGIETTQILTYSISGEIK